LRSDGGEKLSIEHLTADHVPAVVALHLSELPDDFCSALGRRFLSDLYYPYLFSLERHVGLVALFGKRVCGFVTAAPAQGFYTRMLARHPFGMPMIGLATCFRRPSAVRYALEVARLLFSRNAYQPRRGDAELLYEAVDREVQGRSVGSRLVDGLFSELARWEGYQRCVVKTLESTPQSNAFYRKNGFKLLQRAYGRAWYFREIR
jgi:ribosomal protein S18 acetylase RimI-like enzyme